jgi:putative cardiolipin synthase
MTAVWALPAAAIPLLFAAIFGYAYFFGRVGQRRTGPQSAALHPRPGETPLDRFLGPLEDRHPGETGLRLVTDNLEAFAIRRDAMAAAGRSLDVQYYYWKADFTGRLLCHELLRAADRGVRVRVLLDDINSVGFDSTYLALDSHPAIAIRMFNPSRSRKRALRRGLELILKYFTATRRMHNKCLIADGRVAIIGGRNIGDEYFDAATQANFLDADLLAAGAAVGDAAAIFDSYWNSDAALPIRELHRIRKPRLGKLRSRLAVNSGTAKAARYLAASAASMESVDGPRWLAGLHWSGRVEVVADPPAKADGLAREAWLSRRIDALLRKAHHDIRIVSPYFIPGTAGSATLRGLAASGCDIAILTNSLAATDVLAVHGAYARYRRTLLAAGVRLYELKAIRRRKASLFGSRTASLHTKAFLVDRRLGFVGSFNLDPRSASINTEMGVIFEDEVLAAELLRIFDAQIDPDNSYRLSLSAGRLAWEAGDHSTRGDAGVEPGSSWGRIVMARLVGLLPIESQL